jgi:acyl dehydratase
MSFLYLEEFKVGDKFTTMSRTITETDVVLFAGLTGDNNPLHTDQDFCEKTPFGGRIAHGMLGASVVIGLWGRMGKVDGSAIAALDTKWKFLSPIKIGDTIHAEIEITQAKQSSSKPDRGVLTVQYTIVNQEGTVCQVGDMTTMLKWARPKGD